MFSIKLKGPWRQFKYLMGGYDRRLKYVEQRIAEDLAKAFLEKIKEGAPTDPEYKDYLDSLEVVRLKDTGNIPVYAVLSSRTKVKIGHMITSKSYGKMVLYFHSMGEEPASEAMGLIEANNPWPMDMIPFGIPKKDVKIVHRFVTESEIKWSRERAKELIKQNRAIFRRDGISWDRTKLKIAQANELESLPDFMSMAIRAEFGINANPKPHWRPAARWVLDNAEKILKEDENIKSAFHDSIFREHTFKRGTEYKEISAKVFLKEAETFQKKVVGG